MPAKTTSGIVIQDLPLADSKPELLPALINDRFRHLQDDLKVLIRKNDKDNVDIGGNRIVNVGDPKDDLDVVNLRTLKRTSVSPRPVETETTAAASIPDQHYAMIFTKDGFVSDEETSPWLTIDEFREGYPLSALVTAKTAPAGVSLKVNFKILRPEAIDEEDLLDLPLEILVSERGPVFSELGLAVTDKLEKGTRIYMLIVQGGDAEKVTGQIVLRRAL